MLSNVEFRRANNVELLEFSIDGSRGGTSLRGGNGGGDISSLGGRTGAFGACLICCEDSLNELSRLLVDLGGRGGGSWLGGMLPGDGGVAIPLGLPLDDTALTMLGLKPK